VHTHAVASRRTAATWYTAGSAGLHCAGGVESGGRGAREVLGNEWRSI
jgi:hypothetical protein